ncbi:L-sorbose 1-dehydrogenase [Cyphellophora attinorum]|uniref:L-sorbose 1-dehydrogenase n=1 Tax=Cyphellophora attinorum TaxID=1664694 RepID=A0A0N1P4C6_9EURO|nr:L-sorbose 1-dehydrogenase [Phialophora attinorum]KPI45454.1 L-sorbose 1-dehydrogenase [Phialophora attinorum]
MSHDIIIVGGGVAGCALAARLSEADSLQVLLIEAGSDHNKDPRVKTPMLFRQSFSDRNIDWDHHAIPQEEIHGKQTVHPRGKGLGGSSLINYMSLHHPTRSVYDAWASAGNPGWGWDDMLPYIRKFHTYVEPSDEVRNALKLDNIDKNAQGKDGPVQLTHATEVNPLDKVWLETFENIGHAMTMDPLSGEPTGAYNVLATAAANKERSHAAAAYLDSARNRSNLTVVCNAQVTKLIFSGNRATGVIYTQDGSENSVSASKEVILCCGAFESPALLERSGIGRSDVLQRLGVAPALINENVGESLQDHLFTACSLEIDPKFVTFDQFRDIDNVKRALEAYQNNHTGPFAGTFRNMAHLPLLSSADDFDIDGILSSYKGPRTPAFNLAEDHVRTLLKQNRNASATFILVPAQVHMQHTDSLANIIAPTDPGSYVSPHVAISHPLSRGSVHARSTDVGDIIIDPRYYTHPLDVALAARHVKFIDTLINTEPLKSVIVPDGRRIPEWASFDTLDDTEKLLRYSNASFYHPVGTCSMLPREKGGVVDSRLRVYGIEGLRICDASVFPLIPRSSLMSSVYTAAEKAADMIKEDLGVRG